MLAEILPFERLVGVTRFVDEKGTSNVVGRIPPTVFRFPKADMEVLLSRRADMVVISEYTDADFRVLVEHSGMRTHRMVGLDSLDGIRTGDPRSGRGRRRGGERFAPGPGVRSEAFDPSRTSRFGAPHPGAVLAGGMTAGSKTTIGA